MAISWMPVVSDKEIGQVAALADEIWHEHFTPILPEGQVDYMLERFQSADAVRAQIREQGYLYFLLKLGDKAVGYTGVHPENGKLFLSKLYIKKAYRGNGFASETFRFLESYAKGKGLHAIWLTVNINNSGPIAVYQKNGLKIVRTQVADIGQGYVMDDYVMEKTF